MKNVLVAAVLWGTAGTAGLLITADPVSVAAARLVIGGLLLALLARGARVTPALLLGAVAVAAYQLCFFAAVSRTGVAIGTVVAIGSGPIFTGLLSRQFSARWAAATAAAIAGCAALIVGGEAQAGDEVLVGVLLALLGGLIYAFYAVTAAKAINGGAPSDAVMGIMFGGAAVIMLPVLILTGPGWLAEPRGPARRPLPGRRHHRPGLLPVRQGPAHHPRRHRRHPRPGRTGGRRAARTPRPA
ncbi:hypothetical protein [Nonomuraea dietziae]|uniref:hypothetical protein n=1 Tax=Nonomuraea dietziae TaxID=65515 RepID=UPI0031E2ADD7